MEFSESVQLKFSDSARLAFDSAVTELQFQESPALSTEHLLLGLFNVRSIHTMTALQRAGLSIDEAQDALYKAMGHRRREKTLHSTVELSRNGRQALDYAGEAAARENRSLVTDQDLLIGLFDQETGLAARILRRFGVTREMLLSNQLG